MRAWSVAAPAPIDRGPLELSERPDPEPGPGEVRIRVAGNGVCQSDLHMPQLPAIMEKFLGWQMPFTLGHEVGGRVGPGGWQQVDQVVRHGGALGGAGLGGADVHTPVHQRRIHRNQPVATLIMPAAGQCGLGLRDPG